VCSHRSTYIFTLLFGQARQGGPQASAARAVSECELKAGVIFKEIIQGRHVPQVRTTQVAEGLGLAPDAARVDLHGLGAAEARAAVLCALRALQERAAQGAPLPHALTIITGRFLIMSQVLRVLRSFLGAQCPVSAGSAL